MFKIIFSHLYSQIINKPSISSKFNKWGLSKSDININRFENTLFFYKKELLTTKLNIKKSINYNKFFLIESFFILFFFLCFLYIIIIFFIIFLKIIKTETLILSIKTAFFCLFTNAMVFKILLLILFYFFSYFIMFKNKNYIIVKRKLH